MIPLAAAASWKRYLIFCGVGASGLLVDMGLFHLLHMRLGWPLEASKLAAAETALLNNFLWNDRWTFGHRPIEIDAPWHRRLFRFHVICLSGIALTMLFLGVLHRWAGIHAELANAVATTTVCIVAYVSVVVVHGALVHVLQHQVPDLPGVRVV